MEDIVTAASTIVLVAPAVLLGILGTTTLVARPLSERMISRWTQTAVLCGLGGSLIVLLSMLATGERHLVLDFGDWVGVSAEDYHFHLEFAFDRLSVPFAILTYVLVGTTGAFASRYLHGEPGFRRFFLLYAVFLLGMVVASLAGTIEALYFGWELVGLSSALLVAYFHQRPGPVRNGQRVWTVYRLSDAAFLIGAVALHHAAGSGAFDAMTGEGSWPEAVSTLTPPQALLVGSLFLVSAAGKSALIPFCGWLPRAMEGPTPSSAVFYGALSVHLGTFLLLRMSPIIERSPVLAAVIVALGLATALLSSVTQSVQTDVKSSLAYSSLTQVGIITAEIGLGFRYLALIHMLGHASLRALQLLRAPSLLHDYHTIENAIGHRLSHRPGAWTMRLPRAARRRLYRLAFERGGLDALLVGWVATPFLSLLRSLDRAERWWIGFLSGRGRPRDERAATLAIVREEPPQ